MRLPFERSAEASSFLPASRLSKHWCGSFGRCKRFIDAATSHWPG
ncbi:hypothetical protein Syncc8109_1223 [Synechococcus sp. WH 8109]|nr:hypothetical protein Syncc8109_1223 [Synechococcus sp. WH 8109]